MSLNVTLYRYVRGIGKEQKTCKAVRVCEDCLVCICASQGDKVTPAATKMLRALEEAIANGYSQLVKGKAA
jgi:hypothetical protein